MRGLDPRIYDAVPCMQVVLILLLRFIMDCRVKPGNDSREVVQPRGNERSLNYPRSVNFLFNFVTARSSADRNRDRS
jgi:hypothetical protein